MLNMTTTAIAEHSTTMGKLRAATIAMVGASLLLAGVPFLLPETPGSKTEGFLELAVLAMMLSSLAIVAAVLFILGLKGFKDEFKKTYYYICAGLAVQAASLLIYPSALYMGVLYNDAVGFIGNSMYLSGTILIFIGLRHFAGLLKLQTWLRSATYVGVVTIVAALLLWAMPHTATPNSEMVFNILQSPNSIESILSLLAACLVWVIRGQASLFYSRPLLWLMIALACNGTGEFIYFVASHMLTSAGEANPDLALCSGVLFLFSRIFYVLAGYSLIRLTHKEEIRQSDGSPVDVIVYLAGLVSKKADIDPMLDNMRTITASMSADQKLSAEQLHSLGALYQQLRNYLLHKESLLAVTEESLDRKLQHKFGRVPFKGQ
jgi:hypothetical protein